MASQTSAWISVLISWAPFTLLIGFWIYFMRKMGTNRHGKYIERSMVFMDRQEQLLERIAVALEQRKTQS